MKRILGLLSLFYCLFSSSIAIAASTNLYFNINQSGTTLSSSIKVILCLAAGYNCQNYTITNEILSITTTPTNHTYKNATIEIITPGAQLQSFGEVECNPAGTECSFETDNTTRISIAVEESGSTTFFLGGSISGLPPATSSSSAASGLVLHNSVNAEDESIPLGSKSYLFNTKVNSSDNYNVTVSQNPAGYLCSVSNGAGVVISDDIKNINITCDKELVGRLKAWGNNREGQLGLGDTNPRGTASGQMGTNLAFVDVGSGRTVKSIAGGYHHTCALLDNNKVKCWGLNNSGQLGLGDTTNRGQTSGQMGDALPYVNLGTNRTVKSIAGGGSNNESMGHTCALLDNNKVKCWGWNTFGELGLGDTINRGDSPNQMGDALPYVDLGTGRTARKIFSGWAHTCALLDNNKTKCWGRNNTGALGLGDTTNRGDVSGQMGDALPYVNLGTDRYIKSALGMAASNCALLDNNKVKCWGYNIAGQLGLGDTNNRGDASGEMGDALPYVELGTGMTAQTLSGTGHSICALLNNNKVKCWGYNHNGALGLGDTTSRGTAPEQMGDGLPFVELGTGLTATQISSGNDHTCAILNDNTFKCWGDNWAGQLGLGNTEGRGTAPGQMGDSLPTVDIGGVPLKMLLHSDSSFAITQ